MVDYIYHLIIYLYPFFLHYFNYMEIYFIFNNFIFLEYFSNSFFILESCLFRILTIFFLYLMVLEILFHFETTFQFLQIHLWPIFFKSMFFNMFLQYCFQVFFYIIKIKYQNFLFRDIYFFLVNYY